MKITDNRYKPNVVMFKDLDVGDCFEYKGDFYIKMYSLDSVYMMKVINRAFKLGCTNVCDFADDTIVTKVNMEVIIENE